MTPIATASSTTYDTHGAVNGVRFVARIGDSFRMFATTFRAAMAADGALPEEIADLFTLSKGADGAWTIDWA